MIERKLLMDFEIYTEQLSSALRLRDEGVNKLYDYFRKSALAYIAQVVRNQALEVCYRSTLEGREYRERMQEMDKARRIAHDAMMSSLAALERACLKAAGYSILNFDIATERERNRGGVAGAVFRYFVETSNNKEPDGAHSWELFEESIPDGEFPEFLNTALEVFKAVYTGDPAPETLAQLRRIVEAAHPAFASMPDEALTEAATNYVIGTLRKDAYYKL
jgi:hypothetical protein